MKKLLALLFLFTTFGCNVMIGFSLVDAKTVATGFSNKDIDELLECFRTFEPRNLGLNQKIHYTIYSENYIENKTILGVNAALFIFSEDNVSSYKTKIELKGNAFETGYEHFPYMKSIRYCSEETIKHP